MDDSESPRLFRRERNLSNRNFNKRNSNRRRTSTDSHNSADTKFPITANDVSQEKNNVDEAVNTTLNAAAVATTDSVSQLSIQSAPPTPAITSHSHSHSLSVSLVAEKPSVKNNKSILKIHSIDQPAIVDDVLCVDEECQEYIAPVPDTPDPALLGFSQKRNMFESLQADEGILFKTAKFKSKSTLSLLTSERKYTSRQTQSPSSPPTSTSSTSMSSNSGSYFLNAYRVLPAVGNQQMLQHERYTALHGSSIDEERSEDDVDSIKTDDMDGVRQENNMAKEVDNEFGEIDDRTIIDRREDFVEPAIVAANLSYLSTVFQHSLSQGAEVERRNNMNLSDKTEKENGQGEQEAEPKVKEDEANAKKKDFVRNFRSRPLTEISGTQTLRVRGQARFHSQYKPKEDEPEAEEQIEMRDKGYGCIQPILEELIKTEETYVENLWTGINNYGNIFERKDLPIGLRGKKYVLFGNVEQIAEFHRDEFLPMLLRNRHDLKRLFDEFLQFIEQNCFYGYVLFTMNKQGSLKLCDTYKNYFKLLQTELDDRLGINSFLVQPIQRMARYPLLLTQFIQTLFKNREYVLKPVIESCCRLEKRLRNLLITTNESEIINDIVCLNEATEFNTFYQGKFRKVSEFQVYDYSLKRSYRSKVFIFDKCIIYTEIKGKQLIFHGRYPCEHIGIAAKTKSFTLYYQQRKQQECDFTADPLQVEQWLELIKEMIVQYAEEERRKLKELHSRENGGDHMHRKPANLSLFRDSNRFSSDSGIGNIWVVPKPENEEAISNRTTWYAVT